MLPLAASSLVHVLGNIALLVEKLRSVLGDRFQRYSTINERRAYVYIRKEGIRDCVRVLFDQFGARLSTISAVDRNFKFDVLYHFTLDQEGLVASVCLSTPKQAASLDSVTDILPAANWIEREVQELFGIKFVGHPSPGKLLTSDDWPEDEYPLRRIG